jgi:hypothetical protein
MKTRLAMALLRAARALLVADGFRNGMGFRTTGVAMDGALLDNVDFCILVLGICERSPANVETA